MDEDTKFIKDFSKIQIKECCNEVGVSSSNFWAGRLSAEKVHLIRKVLESKIAMLHINEKAQLVNDQSKTGTL